MKPDKNQKAIIVSAICIIVCVITLVGYTLAWFTFEDRSPVNTIVAGSLDVAFEVYDGRTWVNAEGKTLDFLSKQDSILWEPGATYVLPPIRVINKGDQAFKFSLIASGFRGDTKLAKALDIYIDVEGNDLLHVGVLSGEVGVAIGTLNAGEKRQMDVSVKMRDDVGNEYQRLSISDFAFTVYATQSDKLGTSDGGAYDAAASYYVTNGGELRSALEKGGIAVLGNVISESDPNVLANNLIKNDIILDFSSKQYTFGGTLSSSASALTVKSGNAVFTATSGGIQATDPKASAVTVMQGATLVVNSGAYVGGASAVQNSGRVIINGGIFRGGAVLDCDDALYAAGDAMITVYGGTFVNYDPSTGDASVDGDSYVAVGYKVVAEPQINGEIWYKVVKA